MYSWTESCTQSFFHMNALGQCTWCGFYLFSSPVTLQCHSYLVGDGPKLQEARLVSCPLNCTIRPVLWKRAVRESKQPQRHGEKRVCTNRLLYITILNYSTQPFMSTPCDLDEEPSSTEYVWLLKRSYGNGKCNYSIQLLIDLDFPLGWLFFIAQRQLDWC